MTRLAFTYALRELKGGLGGFKLFLACLALGVAVIAGAGSLDAALRQTLDDDGKALLGGDLSIGLSYRPLSADETAALSQAGQVAGTIEMRAMASRDPGGGSTPAERTLVELKAVDQSYPLYGRLTLDPIQDSTQALGKRDGVWGAAADPALLARLGLKIGDPILIGNTHFTLRATIVREPDRVATPATFGPRVLIDHDALADTGLLLPGSLVRYNALVKLPPGRSAAKLQSDLAQRFPDAGWQIRDTGDAAPGLKRVLDQLGMFLGLVGLTALLVGGIGIGDAVAAFMDGRAATIATLKCLGAPNRLILATYGWQVAALALLGIVIGLIAGALVPPFVVTLWGNVLPVPSHPGLYPLPLARAALFGALTAIAFTARPLIRAARLPAASLMRDAVTPVRAGLGVGGFLVIGGSAVALIALAILSAASWRLAAWFVLVIVLAFLLFIATGSALSWIARGPIWRRIGLQTRLAASSLGRPGGSGGGSPAGGMVLSIGLGLTVLVAVALVQANLTESLTQKLPKDAPTFFFIDIPSSQGDAFDQAVTGAGGRVAKRAPMVRGRITRINGLDLAQVKIAADAQWAVRGDRGFSAASVAPPDARLTAGHWWPADYSGPPLVSMDDGIAKGFGIGVGDTVTVNLLGREITARIANLRDINWTGMGMNFTFLFSPNTLAGAPHSDLATVFTDSAHEAGVDAAVARAVPTASAINVKQALDEVDQMVDSAAQAIRAAALLTLISGVMVLAGAAAAGRRRRVREAVILKVLGARRRDLLGAVTLEYAALGIAAGLIAAILGSAASFGVISNLLNLDWNLPVGVLAITILAAIALVAALGLILTARALSEPPAPYLRNQ
jgi:putative ABC transport system permease protein